MDTNKRATWHEAAIEDIENSTLSYAEIGRKYGRSRATIIKLKHRYNLTRKLPVKAKGLSKDETRKSLSREHRAVGSRLAVYRASRTYSEMAEELNVSPYVLRLMELGVYDLTLLHLLRISQLLGTVLPELVGTYDRIGLESPSQPKRGR